MTIHLIPDYLSIATSKFLVDYVSKFFSSGVTFKVIDQPIDHMECWSWDNLFAVGKAVKMQEKRVEGEDFFVVLVAGENDHNWFASFDTEDSSVGFLQTTGWEMHKLNHPEFAMAYHLVTLITAMRFFGNESNPYSFYHSRSVGCMFDFTGFKKEVIYKLKSGHICTTCIEKLAKSARNKGEALAYVIGLKLAIEDIREKLLEVDLSSYFGKSSYQVVIKEDLSLVVTIEGKEIPISIGKGRETSIFMMLLKYRQGLTYDDFKKPRFLKEYLDLYHKYYVNKGSKESLLRQSEGEIEKGTFKGNMQSTICKMKARLKDSLVLYPEIQDQLRIQAGKGPIMVPIDRKYLVNHNADFTLDLAV